MNKTLIKLVLFVIAFVGLFSAGYGIYKSYINNSQNPPPVIEDPQIKFSVDGNVISSVMTTGNEKLTFPTPTKSGYIFNGWYLESTHVNLITEDYFEDKIIDKAITLYARFYNEGFEFELLADNTYGIKSYTGTSSDIVIPNFYSDKKVTSIMGSYAFKNCNMTNINIGSNIIRIHSFSFYNCPSLTSINIPASVTQIDSLAFIGCHSLENIIVDSGNSIYDSRNNCNAIIRTSGNSLIAGCKNTIIPNDVTKISQGAFINNSGLTNISIPNSVTSIENLAFASCTSLINIIIPESVTFIDDVAFRDCYNLTDIYYTSNETRWNAIEKGEDYLDTDTATIYYYSDTTPTTAGNYWHYDTDGITPVKW